MNLEKIPQLETVDAEQLMAEPLENVPFTVDKLISQGLHLLVGDPKVGKSWFTLWLCLKVAQGDPVWKFPVRRGTVLYLCLEDNKRRVQNRLFEMADCGPANLYFNCLAETISTGLIPQIEMFLDTHPDTVLIAIDTLQKVRGVTVDNAGAYASDYRDLSLLKALADKHQLSILLVHHTSKRPNEQGDPFKRISGTTAIIGAADGCMMMYKQTAYDKNATLAVTGRDVERRLLTIRQTDRFDWMLEEDTAGEELQRAVAPPVIGQVYDLVIRCGSWSGTASELSALLDQEEPMPAQVLTGKINRYHDLLYQQGIRYSTKRTATKRMIFLEVMNGKDTGDGERDSTTCRGQAS